MSFSFFTQDIGIDLGTANTLIYCKNKGIILNEPSVIAIDDSTKKILAVGLEAKKMLGRAPSHIRVVRPLQDGVISDFQMTQAMLKKFLDTVITSKSMFGRIRVVVGVPSGVTEVEKRAVDDAVHQMGAKDVFVMDEPMAAAIGAGLPVDEPSGCMVADIGGGTADIAIIALGGIVNSTSLRCAGDEMDTAIVNFMRKSHNLLIGEKTAEEIKMGIGCVFPDPQDPFAQQTMEARGRDIVAGLPKTVEIGSLEVMKALEEPIGVIIDGIKNTLEKAPPELSADIVSSGMMLTGGGALLHGLDRLIEYNTGMKVHIAENALEAVAEGTGRSLEHMDRIHNYVYRDKRY